MKKIINEPQNFVDEMLEGIMAAFPEKLHLSRESRRVLLCSHPNPNRKIGIVTAGGSGHLPVFLGYVGAGMLDGCTVGNVFSTPSARNMAAMIRECNKGNGVLCICGNYGGDVLNLNMACEIVDLEDGIPIETVLVKDDVASSSRAMAERRRGVAGMVYAYKIAGAAADQGLELSEVAAVTRKALDRIRTMGVALSSCIVPEVGHPTFSIGENELEVGMGIHGEPGIEVCPMMTADEIADLVLYKILEDMPVESGSEVSVMVNGLGATPLEEQFIVYRRLHRLLAEKNISVFMPHIGEFATSMEMAGISVTVLHLDEELKRYLRAPANTPFYTNANR